MLRGINSYNNYYNYRSSLNQIRLQQALSKNPSYQKSVAPVRSVDPVNSGLRSSSLDYLKEYSSKMTNMLQEANSLRTLNSAGVINEISVESSQPAVAEVSARYGLRRDTEISMVVDQLAVAQQNVSNAVNGDDLAVQNIALTISSSMGNLQVNVSAFNDDGTQKTNRQMLSEAAAIINRGDHGVSAAIKEENGAVVLSLESKNTGTDSSFAVNGQLGAAEGLDTVERAAENAKYSVTTDGVTRNYTSQSNEVHLDTGRIKANLKGTGETVITTGLDTEKAATAVANLLDSYNETISFLSDNASRGRGTSAQLGHLDRPLAAQSVLKRLGISEDADGNLVLDKEKLKQSLKDEPALTKDLLSGTHGLAETLYIRTTGAMNTNSASLIANDMKQMNAAAIIDPLQYMNIYSRNGSYQMNNYMALGLMMNYLV